MKRACADITKEKNKGYVLSVQSHDIKILRIVTIIISHTSDHVNGAAVKNIRIIHPEHVESAAVNRLQDIRCARFTIKNILSE